MLVTFSSYLCSTDPAVELPRFDAWWAERREVKLLLDRAQLE